MNLILVGLLLIVFTGHTQVQEQLPYKAKATFNQDTLQYLEYNFIERASQYKGKKVSDVIKDFDLPVLYIAESAYSGEIKQGEIITKVKSLSLAVHQVGVKPNALEDYYVVVYFTDPPTFAEYREASGFSRENPNPVFTQKLYDFIKDRTVYNVSSNPYIIEKRENLKKAGKIKEAVKNE